MNFLFDRLNFVRSLIFIVIFCAHSAFAYNEPLIWNEENVVSLETNGVKVEKKCLEAYSQLTILNVDVHCFFGDRPEDKEISLGFSSLQYATGRSSIYQEIASDYLGNSRVAVGVGLAADGEAGRTQQEQGTGNSLPAYLYSENIQRLFGPGGNLVITVYNPWVAYMQGKTNMSKVVYLSFVPRIGFDFPPANTTTNNYAINFDGGLELGGRVETDNSKISFFGLIRGSYIVGDSSFLSRIGVNRPFYMSFWSGGFSILEDKVKIEFRGVFANGAPQIILDALGPVTLSISFSK